MEPERLDNILNDVVSIVSITAIAFLGFHNITDSLVIGAIAGLGGYAVHKRQKQV